MKNWKLQKKAKRAIRDLENTPYLKQESNMQYTEFIKEKIRT